MSRATFGHRVSIRTLVFAATCLVAISARPANAQLTQTDIGRLGNTSTSVTAAAGDYVVGSSNPGTAFDVWGNSVDHAIVWSASTHTMTDIGALLTNAGRSQALSVNSHGEVAGIYYAPDYSSATGFYWSQATGVIVMGDVFGGNGGSMRINESGVVASVDPNLHVFRWTRTGGAVDLGATGDGDAYVAGINGHGDIIGNSGSDSGGYVHAFIAPASANSLTLLSSPGLTAPPPPWGGINTGAVDIKVSGINDSGVVVGTYFDFGYIYDGYDISQGGFYSAQVHNSHAFSWTSTGGFTDIGNLGVSYLTSHSPATFWASANAINNAGTIVGAASLPAGYYGAFVYDPTTSHLTQLASTNVGDAGASATGINDDGVIVGFTNQTSTSVMWQGGVPTNVTPAFAPAYPGAPIINGSRIAGNGADQSGIGHGWTFALASTAPSDTTPPVITVPGNLSAEATGPGGAAVSFAASASDAVDGSVAVSCAPATGSTFPLGTTTVTCTASDTHNNAATSSFTVTVVDTTAPVLSLPSAMSVEATSASGAPASFTASASDLVSGAVAPSCAPASGSTFAIGTTTVSCSATDGAGNTSHGSFNVTVADHTAPAGTAQLVRVGHGGGDDESMQSFQVVFSATDAVGVATLTADLNGIRVTNGQIVQLQVKSGAQRARRDDGRLQIQAPSFQLTVTATDAAGNTSSTTAVPVFVKNGKDRDDDKGKGDDRGKGDDKGKGKDGKGGDR
jgi:probable HAF family extracellular repeat protein